MIMLSKKINNSRQDLPSTISGRNGAGFTLLEMLVSVSIFTIVMTISTGAILTLNDSLQKAKLMRAAVENVSFALEGMAKKIRTGTSIVCLSSKTTNFNFDINYPKDCSPVGGKKISFLYSEQNSYVSYQLNSDAGFNSIEMLTTPFNTPANVKAATITWGTVTLDSITGSDVSITNMTFYVTGACPQTYNASNSVNCPETSLGSGISDLNQPMVKIILTGEAKLPGKSKLDTTFNIETTVSTRLLDK